VTQSRKGSPLPTSPIGEEHKVSEDGRWKTKELTVAKFVDVVENTPIDHSF
jgi:hypothetical protein